MSLINRGTFLPLVKPDLFRVYVETGKERPLEYTSVVNVDDMPFNPATDRQISGLGTLVSKPEGDQFALDAPILGGTKTYTAAPWGLAVEITWEMWRDEQYGAMRELVSEQARASRNRQEVSGWAVLNNAWDSTYTGFDGLCLLNTAHTLLGGGTVANTPTTNTGFSVTAIQNALIAFENMVDERNLPRLMSPSMVIVPPGLRFVAREVLGSAGKPFTTDNEQNSLLQDDLSWMISHYLTNSTSWFVMAAKGQHDLNFMWRDRPIFDAYDDPRTKNAVFTVYQRHTDSTFGSWRGVYGSKAS